MKRVGLGLLTVALLAAAAQADLLTLKSITSGSKDSNTLATPWTFTLTTYSDAVKVTGLWMAVSDGNDANNLDINNQNQTFATGGAITLDLAYSTDGGLNYTPWKNDFSVAEYTQYVSLRSDYRYMVGQTTPVDLELAANTTYTIRVSDVQGGSVVHTGTGDDNSGALDDGTLAYTNSNGTNGDWGIFQFEYDVVPEPATMALLSLGGIGMLIRRHRKIA